ncbi:class I adenylate-forming enzyme family protein [Halosegnis marinus]|uniref:Class I adenylate-forming enzyme family protein n=1 Tax=Halosegnis marinus TaxID=3034023 RepID=A0ABD5ZK68_9EURY|nr:AMP-binding protein [Halosegnis sp. DT85]
MTLDIAAFGAAAEGGNVARLYDTTAEERGDAPALESHGEVVTHADFRAASAAFAGGLHDRGVEVGDALLLYLPNCPQYLVASVGCFRAGVAVSPVNPQYRARELAHQLTDTDASVVVTHAALREHLAGALAEVDADPVVVTVGDEVPEGDVPFDEVRGEPTTVEVEGDHVASLPYTSGTTGTPKGVRLTHDNLRAQLLTSIATRSDDLGPDGVNSLVWLPLYHITGFVHTALQPLVRGGTLYIRSAANWDAEAAMRLVDEESISEFVGVTAMYADMVAHDSFGDYDLTSLVQASEGGAKLTASVQERFEDTANVAVFEGYGLTETTGATHTQLGSTFGPSHGTVGQPFRHTDCRIVDGSGEEVGLGETGELLVRGPQVMAGYHGLPEATEEAFTEHGFFRTGDIARRDERGYFEIVDRKKHVIVTAGYNVYPSEVEDLLAEHEAVREAAVVGVPDERRNETVKAYVVPANGDADDPGVTAEAIKEFSLDRIAAYKHPREVEFIDELPRTASGKIQKYKLEGE